MHDIVMFAAIFVVAALYSAVGHGGASGYLAVLSLASVPHDETASTSLLLNILVATLSAAAYARAGHLNLKLAAPFIALSVPAAFLGGLTPISDKVYYGLLALALGFSAYRLAFFSNKVLGQGEPTPAPYKVAIPTGAALGWISGMIGIGGGVFLSPVMLLRRWATPQQTSAIAALFIVVNSIAGMLGRLTSGSFNTTSSFVPLVVAAVLGGAIGSHLGANSFSRKTICQVLAAVLSLAVAKLALEVVH
jgi:hypothetical protein